MPIAADGQGNYLTLGDDGQWAPAQVATNPQTGTRLVLDGQVWKPMPGEEPSALGSAARGVARGVGLGFSDELGAAGDAIEMGVRGLFGGQSPGMAETYNRSLAQRREQARLDRATNPVSSAVGEVAGNVATTLGGGAVSEAAGLTAAGARAAAPVVGRLNPFFRQAAGYAGAGAAGGAVTGFGEGEGGLANRASSAVEGGLVGGALGLGTGAAVGAAGHLISPIRPRLSPEQQALVGTAQHEGIPLSLGQETGSRTLKNAEAVMAQLPGSSSGEAEFADTQRRAFNQAVLSRAGINSDIASPQVLNDARDRIGGVIDTISNRNVMQVTPQLANRLTQIEADLRYRPAEAAAPVRARLEQLQGMQDAPAAPGATPTVPGASYRMLDSQLGRSIRGTTNGDLRTSLGELRDALRQAMDLSISPQDQAAWAEARRQYANLMVAADAAKGAGGATAEGHISPLALRTALDHSTGGGYVWGRGDLNDLARVGQSLLRPVPDSGTGGRTQMNSILTGGAWSASAAGIGSLIGGPVGTVAGAAAPLVLPRLAQRAMQSDAGRAYLLNSLGTQLHGPVSHAAAAAAAAQTERNRLMR